MAYCDVRHAPSLNANLQELEYDALLSELEAGFRANGAIENGIPNGLLHTLQRRQGGALDGIDSYVPGIDNVTDLDIQATYANEEPLARKHLGDDSPLDLHIVADWGERYHASTGVTSLNALSRLSVAMASMTGDHTQSQMHAIFTGENGRSLRLGYDDERDDLDAQDILKAYDSFVIHDGSTVKPKKMHTLTEQLEFLADEDADIAPETDVLVIASDWLGGTERDRKGNLKGFSWERPLQALHQVFEDRLCVIRLVTPAQEAAPFGLNFTNEVGQERSLDVAGYLRLAEVARQKGSEKSRRIIECLQNMRYLELSSQDETPLFTMTDFMFGDDPTDV